MNAWPSILSFALKEFFLPFKWSVIGWRRGSCPGGRDFLFLTIIMTLILSLGGFVIAAHQGVLGGMIGTFLGELKGAGIPLWVQSNFYNGPNLRLISSSDIRQMRESQTVHPFRYVTVSGEGNVFDLPGDESWRRTERTGGNPFDAPTLTGIAVDGDDPLWEGNPPAGEVPLVIRISRAAVTSPVFRRHFDLRAYQAALRRTLPDAVVDEWLATMGPDCARWVATDDVGRLCDPLRLRVLWLEGKRRTQDGRTVPELLPFDVQWVERVRTPAKPAFLIPLSTFHLWQAIQANPAIAYHPEAGADPQSELGVLRDRHALRAAHKQTAMASGGGTVEAGAVRVSALELDPAGTDEVAVQLGDLSGFELQDGDQDIGLWPRILLNPPQAEWLVAARLGPSTRHVRGWTTVRGTAVAVGTDAITVTCLSQAPVSGSAGGCPKAPLPVAGADMSGFDSLVLYVPDRARLSQAQEFINTRAELRLNALYSEALRRYGFLTEMLEALKKPVMVVFLGFSALLIFVVINAIVSSRRSYYGVLATKGIGGLEISGLLGLQITVLFAMALALSACALLLLSRHFVSFAAELLTQYLDVVATDHLDMLPLTTDIAITAALALAWVYTACVVSLIGHGVIGRRGISTTRLLAR